MIDGDCAKETHLSAFIDCHSRFVVDARYYYRENLSVLIDSLLRAWANHGASRELYADNAGIYHARALKTACVKLNIKLLHRAVRDPPGGGVIERFFETAQSQFESEVRAGEILTLEKLNQAFSAWLEMSYHERTHSETGQSPRLRYEADKPFTRHVDLQRVLKYFLKREERGVDPDFSDVRISGLFFRVHKDLRRDKVEVRYDPFGDLESVLIYSLEGEYLGTGVRHQREVGEDHSGTAQLPAAQSQIHLSAAGLLKLLVSKLGEVPRLGKHRLFEQILEKAHQAEGALLVILDEAHLLDADALTDIRLLISSALDDAPPLKVVLVGQDPLRHTLRQSSQAALLSRIGVRYHLAPLSKTQTASYIDFQLKQAGGSEKLFEDSTKALIHDYSGGIPRQINNLATASLLLASAENAPRVSESILQQTFHEFQMP